MNYYYFLVFAWCAMMDGKTITDLVQQGGGFVSWAFFSSKCFFYYFNLFSKNSFSGGKCFLDIFFIIKKNQKIH